MRKTFFVLALCVALANCAGSPNNRSRYGTIKEVTLEKVYTRGASTGAMVGTAVGMLSGSLTGATTGYAAGLAVDDAAKDVVYDYDAWNVLVELDNGEVLRIGSRKYYGSHFEAGQRIEIYSPIAADGSALFRPAK